MDEVIKRMVCAIAEGEPCILMSQGTGHGTNDKHVLYGTFSLGREDRVESITVALGSVVHDEPDRFGPVAIRGKLYDHASLLLSPGERNAAVELIRRGVRRK